jgi:hypothetical protein
MKRFALLAAFAIFAPALFACRHEGAYAGRSFGEGETETVYLTDRSLSRSIAIDAQEVAQLPNGALQVRTVLRNRRDEPVYVECSTEFKNANNIGIGDVTGWQFISLQPRSSVTYTSISTATDAAAFTVHIRPASQ